MSRPLASMTYQVVNSKCVIRCSFLLELHGSVSPSRVGPTLSALETLIGLEATCIA